MKTEITKPSHQKNEATINMSLNEYTDLVSRAEQNRNQVRYLTDGRQIIQIYETKDELINDLVWMIREKDKEIIRLKEKIIKCKTEKGFKPFWMGKNEWRGGEIV